MWYTSATAWEICDGAVRHLYTIKYAESLDGIDWKTSSRLCLDYRPEEYALARPVVYHDGDCYRMLFSFRAGDALYSIGSARSDDGIGWQRDAETYLSAAGQQGWESEMACYAWPFSRDGRSYVLYNGNGYGRDGFGSAVAEP
jgi:hypothetical protein